MKYRKAEVLKGFRTSDGTKFVEGKKIIAEMYQAKLDLRDNLLELICEHTLNTKVPSASAIIMADAPEFAAAFNLYNQRLEELKND